MPHHSRLIAEAAPEVEPEVAVHFDNRSLKLLFDADRRPVDSIFAGSLDVRGTRPQVLATWRCFELLAQRASGLRAVQGLWVAFRDRDLARWGAPVRAGRAPAPRGRPPSMAPPSWPALDWLDRRYPPEVELDGAGHPPFFRRARSLWDGARERGLGRPRSGVRQRPAGDDAELKARVTEEILTAAAEEPRAARRAVRPMRDYVGREGKGLRPTLIIASCMALGGAAEDAVRAAAALELFHNGFLVHDDIADDSTHRRGQPTLHEKHGVGLAVNAGDAMNLFAVDLVLSNLPTLGLSANARADPRGAAHVPGDGGGTGDGAGLDPAQLRAAARRRLLPHEHARRRAGTPASRRAAWARCAPASPTRRCSTASTRRFA